MRTRDVAFLCAASIGAFYGGVELLRGEPEPVADAPVVATPATGSAPAYEEEAPRPVYGWIPAEVPAPVGGSLDEAEWEGGATEAPPPGDAGVWSSPAEFAPSD